MNQLVVFFIIAGEINNINLTITDLSDSFKKRGAE